jgi:hypothetical protein
MPERKKAEKFIPIKNTLHHRSGRKTALLRGSFSAFAFFFAKRYFPRLKIISIT